MQAVALAGAEEVLEAQRLGGAVEAQEIDRRVVVGLDNVIDAEEENLRDVGRDMARNVAARAKEWQREALVLVESLDALAESMDAYDGRPGIPTRNARDAFVMLRAMAHDPLVEDWEG